jgi:cell division protein ZipA
MEMNTIIGIVIAVVIMLVGLIMILRKPKPVEPSLEADLHINPESNQPVIPRHVRDQILKVETPELAVERVEPSFKTNPIEAAPVIASQPVTVVEKASEPEKVQEIAESAEVKTSVATEAVLSTPTQTEEKVLEDQVNPSDKLDEAKVEPELTLNPSIETVEIAEFDGESNILDVHLHEQQRYDDESALATAEEIIALNVYPNPRRALSGDKALKVFLKYG